MKIQILNRNNNAIYEVDEAPIFSETKNETLDSGTVVISNIKESDKIKIEPYDIVAIYYDDGTFFKYLCVDTYTETMQCVKPKIFKYEISLFSETKQLETVILPNLKITKVWGEIRSIYYYINQYMTEYCPKIRKRGYVVNTLLNTVTNRQVSIEDGVYYYTVTIKSASIVINIPNISDLKVSSTATVTLTPGGIGQQITDSNCVINSSTLSGGYWTLQYKMTLGEFNTLPIVSLDDYTVYEDSYSYVPKFAWQITAIQNKFNSECPEMQWNTPTLREVLNDLMMVKDCIPILKNGELSFMDLTTINQYGDKTNDSNINYVTRSKSSEDFISELQVSLENVTNETPNVNNLVSRVEYVPFMVDENQVAISENNCFVKTKYPIYKLKRLTMMFPGHFTVTYDGGFTRVDIDMWIEENLSAIPHLVTEYQEWITKPIVYYAQPPQNRNHFADSQNFSLYYTRGTNRIENFFNKTRAFLWVDVNLYKELQEFIIRQRYIDLYPDYSPSDATAAQYYQTMFKIEYETLAGCLFRASKEEFPDNERIVVDNQTNSYVDSYSQGFLEYQKANRLGNEQLQINARYPATTNLTALLRIGDTYEDTIIYQCQYQFYRDHIEVNALATKNYILREYFTGVKSKIRSWAIASGSEALTRRDINKIYCELSFTRYKVRDTNIGFYGVDADYFASSLVEFEAQPLRYVAIKNSSSRNLSIPDSYTSIGGNTYTTYYCLDLINRIVGNSIIVSFDFNDNFYLEKSVNVDEINSTTMNNEGTISWTHTLEVGGLPTTQYSYTDDLGELTQCDAIFVSDIKVIPTIDGDIYKDPSNNEYINPSSSNYIRQQFQFACYLRPRILDTNMFDANSYSFPIEQDPYDYRTVGTTFSHHKDSQEMLSLSTQFEFCTDTQNIRFTKEFINRQKAVYMLDNILPNLKLYVYNKSAYNPKTPDVLPTETPIEELNVNIKTSAGNQDVSNCLISIMLSDYPKSTQLEAWEIAQRYANKYCFYLQNTEFNISYLLLAFTEIPDTNCGFDAVSSTYYPTLKLAMNLLATRNKHIYSSSNPYLIDSELKTNE